MKQQPTLAELRGRVFKGSRTRSGEAAGQTARSRLETGLLDGSSGRRRFMGRGSQSASDVSANQVTLLALLANLSASVAIATGYRTGFVAGVLLAQLAYWLDHVDGQLCAGGGQPASAASISIT